MLLCSQLRCPCLPLFSEVVPPRKRDIKAARRLLTERDLLV